MSILPITSHTLRVESLPSFEALIVEHNRKIAKLNKRHNASLLPLSYAVVRTREVTKEEVQASMQESDDSPGVRTYAAGTIVAEINLSGERPVIAGWTIIGVLTATDEGYLVSRVSDAKYADVAPYAKRGGDCDHCQASRRRTTTYLLRKHIGKTEEGQPQEFVRVIGSTCLKDFTGHPSPALLVAYADFCVGLDAELSDLENEDEDGPRGGSGARTYHAVGLAKFLGYVRTAIREYGWVSKAKSYDTGERSTSTRATEAMAMVSQFEWAISEQQKKMALATDLAMVGICVAAILDYQAQIAKLVPTAADVAGAAEDLALVDDTFSALPSTDDFQSNILTTVRQGYAFGKNTGLAAAICRAAERIRSDKAREESRNTGLDEHFGTVGKRETWVLKCVFTTTWESQFGATQLCIFVDSDGRKAKWFNTGRSDLSRGTSYSVKGTVKAHEVYEGKRITLLSRCKVEEIKAPAAEAVA